MPTTRSSAKTVARAVGQEPERVLGTETRPGANTPDTPTGDQGGTQGEQETRGTPGNGGDEDPSGDDANCPKASAADRGDPTATPRAAGDSESGSDVVGKQQLAPMAQSTLTRQRPLRLRTSRPAGSTNDRLPFTGLIVFPLWLGGAALLAAGLVLRRQAS